MHQLFSCDLGIIGDLSKNTSPEVLSFMNRHHCYPSIRVFHDKMAPMLSDWLPKPIFASAFMTVSASTGFSFDNLDT